MTKFLLLAQRSLTVENPKDFEGIGKIQEGAPAYYKIREYLGEQQILTKTKKSESSDTGVNHSLLPPLVPSDEKTSVAENADDEHNFGLTVGSLVHKALELWLFPDDEQLERILSNEMIYQTSLTESQREQALKRSYLLLRRFQKASIYQDIINADDKRHEIPFYMPMKGYSINGIIDLLTLKDQQWTVIDFKTDAISTPAELEKILPKYQKQISQYVKAVNSMLKTNAQSALCFLDYCGGIHVECTSPEQKFNF